MLKIEFWDILFTVINLLIFYLLIKKFLLKPIKKIIDARQQMVQADFDAAVKSKEEAEQLKNEYEENLRHAEADAEEITQKAHKKAERQKEKIISSASEEAKQIVANAQKNAQQEYDQTMSRLESDIASLAMEAAEKVIKGNSAESGTAEYDEFLKEVNADTQKKKSDAEAVTESDGRQLGVSEESVLNAEQALENSPELARVLDSPVVSYQEKCEVIDKIFDDDIKTFIKVVCKNEKASELKSMFAEYKRYRVSGDGIAEAELFYTVMPTDEQQEGIKSFVKNKTGVHTVNLKLIEKPELEGGFVLKIGDLEYDRSYKGRLDALRQRLVRR